MKISAKAGNRQVEVTVERWNGGYRVEVDGVTHDVDVRKLEADFYSILADGKSYEVSVEPTRDGYQVRHGAAEQLVTLTDPGRRARETLAPEDGPHPIVALMPGKVVRILVHEEQAVSAGQGLVVVEAMKMENEIVAPRDGRVESIAVEPGQTVESGAELLVIG